MHIFFQEIPLCLNSLYRVICSFMYIFDGNAKMWHTTFVKTLSICVVCSRGLSRSSLDHHPLPEEADDNQASHRHLHDLQEVVSAHNR